MPLIDEGQTAPAVNLPDQHGTNHCLEQHAGRPVVLYFYPKDDTSGCTNQACQFRDLWPTFEQLGVPVFGVSPDDVESHRKFAVKYDLPFTLLADVPGSDGVPKAGNAYGVWQEKSMYGRRYMGVVRTTYLIDAAGNVARRWDNVKVPGHAEVVLEAINALDA